MNIFALNWNAQGVKIGLLQKRILQQSLDYISERYCACLKTKSLKIQT